jgi:predicted thioesterase
MLSPTYLQSRSQRSAKQELAENAEFRHVKGSADGRTVSINARTVEMVGAIGAVKAGIQTSLLSGVWMCNGEGSKFI